MQVGVIESGSAVGHHERRSLGVSKDFVVEGAAGRFEGLTGTLVGGMQQAHAEAANRKSEHRVFKHDTSHSSAPARLVRLQLKEDKSMAAPLDWSQCPAVESIPGKRSGAWVFKGTRMPVSTVFENLQDMTVDELVEEFGVTRPQVQAVLEFAARSAEVSALSASRP